MQTRTQSLIESITNTVIGYIVALLSQLVIFHAEGIHASFAASLRITFYFTIVSIVRSYCLRRFFNRRHSATAARNNHVSTNH